MKTLIILIFVFFSSFTFAQSNLFNKHVKVTREGERIFLQGKDCKLLDGEAMALAKWTMSVKEHAPRLACVCNRGVCKKEITVTIPDFVEAYQFKHVTTDGPNCWNATLVAAKIVPQVRYTSDYEMNFWMHSPLCKERKAGEELEPGDIIAIRRSDHHEVHGFVHISENLSFSKNGYDKRIPYSLQDPKVVFDTYEVPENCRRANGQPKNCSAYAIYYSCTSMDDYLKKNPIKEEVTKKAYEQMLDAECRISEAVLSGKGSQELKTLIFATLDIIGEFAYDTLMTGKYSPEDKVIWQALVHKSKSLKDQITLM